MKRRSIKNVIHLGLVVGVMFVGFGSCDKVHSPSSTAKVAGKSPGQLRGYQAMNDFFKAKIRFSTYESILSYGLSNTDMDLIPLLGAFGGTGGNSGYENSISNATNIFIMRALFKGVSTRLARNLNKETNCSDVSYYSEDDNVEYVKIISAYCQNPGREKLEAVWGYWMGIEHADQFESWYLEYAKTDTRLTASEADFFVIYFSFFMNPYFLFET